MQAVGASYFNDRLQEKFLSIDEAGNLEEMAVHAFVVRGKQITFNLKERVKQFLVDGQQVSFVEANKELGMNFLGQYNYLIGLIAGVNAIAKDFREKLKTYDRESDQKITASCAVMGFADAERITLQFETFCTIIINDFLTPGRVRRYLPDRIVALKELLNVK